MWWCGWRDEADTGGPISLCPEHHMRSPTAWKFYQLKATLGMGWGLMMPVWVLWLLDLNFDMTDVALLITIGNLVGLVAEIPTGVVADRFSRRGSVAIAQGLYAAAFTLMVVGDTFVMQALCWTLWGVAGAFRSGALSSLLFDGLKAEGHQDDFQQVFSNGMSIGIVSLVCGAAACGIMADELGLVAPLCGAVVFCALGVPVALAIPEPAFLVEARRSGQDGTSVRQTFVEYGHHVARSVRIVHGSVELRALFYMQAVIIVPLVLVQHFYTQPYLSTFDYSAKQISYVYTGLYLMQAVLSKYSVAVRQAVGSTDRRSFLVITTLVLAAIALMAHAPTGVVVIAGLVAIRAAMALALPTLQDSLNRRLDSEQRASCLSLASMGQSALMALSVPVFGYFADLWSLKMSLLILEGIFVPLLLLTYLAGRFLVEPPAPAVESS